TKRAGRGDVKAASGPGVVALMDGAQVFAVYVRVQLRGGEIGVAEHFLDGAPVGAPEDGPHADARQRGAPGVEKQDPPPPSPVERGPDFAGVQGHGAERAPAHGNEALLGALAEEAGEAVLVEDVLQADR